MTLFRMTSLAVLMLAAIGWIVLAILIWNAEANMPTGPRWTAYPVLSGVRPPPAGWEGAVARIETYRYAQIVCVVAGVVALIVHLVGLNLQMRQPRIS